MPTRVMELDLPLGEPFEDVTAAITGGDGRLSHLRTIPGVDSSTAARLARLFPSLGAVYAAPEDRLAAVVGPVAAARIRWFLDAPMSSAAMPGGRPRVQRGWHRAA